MQNLLKTKKRCQQGFVLVLFALSLVVVLGLIGFLIEQARLITARRQATHFARFAALSALDEWYRIDCDDVVDDTQCFASRRNAALQRVNELIGANVILGSELQDIVVQGDSDGVATGAALMTPGRYETDQNICTQFGHDETPCFRSLQDSESPNAIEISGSLYNFVQTGIGGQVLRNAIAPIDVRGRAALVARRGYFLVDFSPTTTQATYPGWQTMSPALPSPPYSPRCGQGHYFAYEMDPSVSALDYEISPLEGHLLSGTVYGPRMNWLRDRFPERGSSCNDPDDDSTFARNCTLPSQYRPTALLGDFCLCLGARTDANHCHSDYMYKRTLSDSAYNSSAFIDPSFHPSPFDDNGVPNSLAVGNGQWFWLNGHAHDIEPLNTIFLALEKALTLFTERSVLSDRAGLIFFNERLSWLRTFLLTNDFEHLAKFTGFATVPVAGETTMMAPDLLFSPGKEIVATNLYNTRDRELLVRHGVVPSALNHSDYYQALLFASQQLTLERETSNIPSSSFVVVIGDLMHNCVNCIDGWEELYEYDETKVACGATIPGIPPQRRCNQHYRWFADGMKEVEQIIQQSFIPNNVPVHVIGIGEHMGFHTLAKLNENGDYYTDFGYRKAFSELEQDNITNYFVRGCTGTGPENTCTLAELEESFDNASYSRPFFEGNVPWYSIALRTQGVWAPIQRQWSYANCENSIYKDDQGVKRIRVSGLEQRELENPYCLTQKGMLVNAVDQIMKEKPLFVFD